MNFINRIKSNPLFTSIQELDQVLKEITMHVKKYKKGDVIFSIGEEAKYIGILLSGEAHVQQIDYWGNQTILTILHPIEMFGEAFACSNSSTMPVQVSATQDCEILFTSYELITNSLSSSILLQNLCIIIANKNVQIAQKMELLSKRTTREKISAYLNEQAIQNGNASFEIPFNRQQMADYLCVDRSALSRELMQMQQDGYIAFHKNQFCLHNINEGILLTNRSS